MRHLSAIDVFKLTNNNSNAFVIKVSVVIPTYNRKNRLLLLLGYLNQSSYPLEEVIIVDSGEEILYPEDYLHFNQLKIIYLTSEKSVCVQRNTGIQRAIGEWIFLCDDDIEVPPDYVEKLLDFIKLNPTCGAVAGRCVQEENGVWVDQFPVRNFIDLFWRYIFQTSVWGEVSQVSPPSWLKNTYSKILAFYQSRGNTSTRAGWPLITQWTETFSTSFYSLGANLIRRTWLVQSPYDEVLDPNGIGDNYGVALGFPGKIHVLSTTVAYHHLEVKNRMHPATSYYRRILALHYFIRKSDKYPASTERWFLWSLFGNCLEFMMTFRYRLTFASWKAFGLILLNRNPYWVKFLRTRKSNR